MKLAIVIGSTREGRKTPNQAQWVLNEAKQVDGIEAEIVDLRDYPLPFFNEAISPRYNPDRVVEGEVKAWLDKIDAFDAYIFVTPEYNHTIPAVLKNSIDYITWELQRKPAAVISHGSAGGARAATDLKEVLSESRSAIIPTLPQLSISGMSEQIDESGELAESIKANPWGPQAALGALIKEIKWYSDALAPARASVKPGLETA
jgi:NAD(P)H-dependent FMN reductase